MREIRIRERTPAPRASNSSPWATISLASDCTLALRLYVDLHLKPKNTPSNLTVPTLEKCFDRCRTPKQIPLYLVDSQPTQDRQFGLCLHTFGDDHASGLLRKPNERGGQRTMTRIGVDLSNQTVVELDDVQPKSLSVNSKVSP